jgi:hypothetical protein
MKEFNTDMGGRSSTLANIIISYMDSEYTAKGVQKFSTIMILEHVQTIKKSWTKAHVMSEISHLKRDGVVVNLEKIPDGRGAVFFTLASILEQETAPTKSVTIPAQTTKSSSLDGNNVMTEAKQVATPATAPNPFNKVNTQLEQIISQLNGLAQGYSELAQRPNTPVDVDGIIAGLTNLNESSSLVYAVREELWNNNEELIKDFAKLISTVDGSEDYKRGVKDGIKLASELGLVVTKE